MELPVLNNTTGQEIPWTPALFHAMKDSRVLCTLCPHACLLPEGGLGVCRVRRRNGKGLETATYSTSVLHWDAIERKPLYHYRPGFETLTIAAPGCSLACG